MQINKNQNEVKLHPISEEPWAKFKDQQTNAAFSISHYGEGIRLRYVVNEPYLYATKRSPNTDIHQDNCVEFFIDLGDNEGYYNFEFNCLGSVKAAFGKSRRYRRYLPSNVINSIADQITLSVNNLAENKFFHWEITANIPVAAFISHPITSLSSLRCKANFTKCGDALPIPHFKSWIPIDSPAPNFHLPEAFGEAIFEAEDISNQILLP